MTNHSNGRTWLLFLPLSLLLALGGSIAEGQHLAEPTPAADDVAVVAARDTSLGIVTDLPPGVRGFACASGWMVAYEQPIPGTKVAIQMVPIPGGTFRLGSPQDELDRNPHEGPQVEIRVEPFWMGRYEVTWEEYKCFMRMYGIFKTFQSKASPSNGSRVGKLTHADAVTIPTPLYDPSFTYALGEELRQPAATMTQYAAKQYTKWLSRLTDTMYRLPCEAEWEYACRAGTVTRFGFGDDSDELDAHAIYFENSDDVTYPVGSKAANAWGLHDMHGNVAELVLDQLDDDHYRSLAERTKRDGQPLPALSTVCWPRKVFQRVTRGGSWMDDPRQLRSAARNATADWRGEDPNLPKSPWWFTDEESLGVGFRIVRPLAAVPADKRPRYWHADTELIRMAVEDRMLEGRGVTGLVDPTLPAAIRGLKE